MNFSSLQNDQKAKLADALLEPLPAKMLEATAE
jgi:hypothetical protein